MCTEPECECAGILVDEKPTWLEILSEGMLIQSLITVVMTVAWLVFIGMGIQYPTSFETILQIVIGFWFGSVVQNRTLRAAGLR